MRDHGAHVQGLHRPSGYTGVERMPDTVETQAQASPLPVPVAPLLFALAAFCAVLPLLLQGCSCGHDFDFHLQSWMEAAWQWKHGILKPVWAFTPAFNAGEPRLLMYPPLSWVTGAALGLLLPWPAVPAAFTGLVLFLCGLTMHRLVRRWTSPAVAVLCGCLYMANPYMLFVSYERTAYAELMAAAWMPLLLAAMLRPRISVPRLSLVVALLWLTNAPAAVVGCYSILLLGVARLLWVPGARAKLRFAGLVTAGVFLGLLLDAFYLIPMGWERRLVQLALAVVPIARPENNFLFTVDNDAFHTHVLLQASWIAIAVCTVAALCGATLLLLLRKERVLGFHSMRHRETAAGGTATWRHVVATLSAFTLCVFFLLCRWSAPAWRLGPELVYLQFPWRFLTVESAVAVFLIGLLLQRLLPSARAAVWAPSAVVLVALLGWFAGGGYFREACGDDETVPVQRAQFLSEEGVPPTDEYTPNNADNGDLPIHLPPAWIAGDASEEPGKHPLLPRTDRSQPEHLRFVAEASDEPRILLIRLRSFFGWHVLRDGREIQPGVRSDGLLYVPLPPGRAHRVEVQYRTTADQWAGLAISALALAAFGLVVRRSRSGIMGQTA